MKELCYLQLSLDGSYVEEWVNCIVGGSISRSSRSGSDSGSGRGSSGTRGSSRTTSRRSLGSGRDVISGISCGGSR